MFNLVSQFITLSHCFFFSNLQILAIPNQLNVSLCYTIVNFNLKALPFFSNYSFTFIPFLKLPFSKRTSNNWLWWFSVCSFHNYLISFMILSFLFMSSIIMLIVILSGSSSLFLYLLEDDFFPPKTLQTSLLLIFFCLYLMFPIVTMKKKQPKKREILFIKNLTVLFFEASTRDEKYLTYNLIFFELSFGVKPHKITTKVLLRFILKLSIHLKWLKTFLLS